MIGRKQLNNLTAAVSGIRASNEMNEPARKALRWLPPGGKR
jgi:hypothetical protein